MTNAQRSRIWLSLTAVGLTCCSQHGTSEPPDLRAHERGLESAASCDTADTPAKTLSWRGYTWDVIEGGMAGVAEGDPNNVFVDANGYLHLRVRKQGNTWTAAEMYTRERLGFGTYQWQIEGPLDVLDKNVVLGLFTYGPRACIGEDGQNEIDFEYSRWGKEAGPNVSWTNYPAVGNGAPDDAYQPAYFKLNGGKQTTSRFVWTPTSITDSLMSGYTPVGSNQGLVLDPWTYAPQSPQDRITQEPVPLAINLWCHENTPSDGKDVEVIIRDFQFVPLDVNAGDSPGDGSGAPSTGEEPTDPETSPGSGESNSDIGASATAYAWSANTSATANGNRLQSAGLNDDDTSSSIPLNEAGEDGAARWEAAGLLWTKLKTISEVGFINGAIDSYGNGFLQQSCSLQFTTDGTNWVESGWTLSPEYPYSTAAGGQSYTFSGPELQGVLGVRVSGQTGEESWSFNVAELRAVGR
jgi:hypothetical protein